MANYSNRIRRDLLKYGKKTICYIDEYDNGTFKVKTSSLQMPFVSVGHTKVEKMQ